MNIGNYLNKTFFGNDFNSWNYDESYSIEELERLGFPYSMACIEINENSTIAVDTGDSSPQDYIRDNQDTIYTLDPTKSPRFVTKSYLGSKNIFYAKIDNDVPIKNETRWTQYTINLFKEDGKLFGAPVDGNFAPLTVDSAYEKVQNKLREIRYNNEKLSEDSVGSAFFQMDFVNEEPFVKTSFQSHGFSYNELVKMIQLIYKNIPSNRK